MQESSKKNVLRCISQQDSLEDMEVCGGFLSSDRFQSSTCWPTSTPGHTLWHMILQLYMYEGPTMTDIVFDLRSPMTESRRSCSILFPFARSRVYLLWSTAPFKKVALYLWSWVWVQECNQLIIYHLTFDRHHSKLSIGYAMLGFSENIPYNCMIAKGSAYLNLWRQWHAARLSLNCSASVMIRHSKALRAQS